MVYQPLNLNSMAKTNNCNKIELEPIQKYPINNDYEVTFQNRNPVRPSE